ncbi:MAG: patatin-like phospholipase family protein [Alphaproteobacteria bacterium]|nr:patatin-like phospholipase family protein [Alphaproteobacteria bacterium]
MKCKAIITIAFLMLAGGCAAQLIREPVPAQLIDVAEIENFSGVRYWGDSLPKNIKQEMQLSHQQSLAQRPHLFYKGQRKEANFLAISGGGSDGAFGAGLLKGWSEKGNRPEFDLITGISTGALAAPFVFLGTDYNRQLEEMYTHYGTSQLVEPQILAGLLGGPSIADNSKLAKIIAGYVDYKLLQAVAAEHNKGRRLLIGTTNLDAERPVVWNMGQIAQAGNKQALVLFRKILLASASIPAVFPPVVIDVSAQGRVLQELHVDGGTTGQVFFLPPQLLFRELIDPKKMGRRKPKFNLYIVMNTPLTPKWQAVGGSTKQIAGRSLWTLMKQQAISDLYKLYVETKNNSIAYHLASVPASFTLESKETFDRKYMKALFDVGRELGQKGYAWSKTPPGLTSSSR